MSDDSKQAQPGGDVTSPAPPCAGDDPEARQRECDREFDHYYDHRKEWTKAQLDSETRYDALLTTICTLALGATLLKGDLAIRGGAAGVAFLVVAWIGFASCLILSLLHQFLTYETHRRWLAVVDAEFDKRPWTPGAMGRALAKYDDILFIKRVEALKIWAGVAVLLGIVASFVFFCTTLGAPSEPPKPAPPPSVPSTVSQTVSLYAPVPATMPTTQPGRP